MKNYFLVSVCSPVFNEAENLPHLVRRVHETMAATYPNFEQVLVDDGSMDRSVEVIDALRLQYPNIRLYRHVRNLGESCAWETAFQNAAGDIIVMLAADLQSPPEGIPTMVDLVAERRTDLATGFRQNRKDGFFYWAATRILNRFMCAAFGLRVLDVSSSYFAVKREFLKDIKLYKNDHRYILAILKRRGAGILEIPFQHHSRVLGKSKYSKSKVIYAIPEILRFTIRFYSGRYDLQC
jgi:glycosyltransferase involved in cell wall biosynthesis